MKEDTLRVDDGSADEVKYMAGLFAYIGNGAGTLLEWCCRGVM